MCEVPSLTSCVWSTLICPKYPRLPKVPPPVWSKKYPHLREVVEREPPVPVIVGLHVEVVAAPLGGHRVEPLRRQIDPLEVRRLRGPFWFQNRTERRNKRQHLAALVDLLRPPPSR